MNYCSLVAACLIILSSCADQAYVPGDLYSVSGPEGQAVVKIMKAEPDVVYVKVYSTLPSSKHSLKEFGLTTVPVNIDEFTSWNPERITDAVGPENAVTLRSDLQ
jgi:hypothetical protein